MTPYGVLFGGLAVISFGGTILLAYEAIGFFKHWEPITVTTRREALRFPLIFGIIMLALGILIGHLFFGA
jgi:hypothetical protein